ncbi:filamentous hemagglutinin N-terminal domain-containing protein [Verrucomicrobium sp. GAS474]|uniref:two-partner secretion domain-containing protein n=1 Tax=Verrucomicrobium sp. GAS474 TaxID=1882831 RepID=UPI0012FF9D11|nr:filamentous hemagglutinin N-terminal domain-containing protein [Verrucomicrobium sp. GAS474]
MVGLSVTPWELRANPTGGDVVSGSANISSSGNTLTVVNSNGAVINWQDFSIGAGELTKFIQSDANSTVLNRVVGTNLSQIYGTLSSNGKVFLINPNGVMIGATGIVNTAGFMASTLDINNADFIANNGSGAMHFVGNSTAAITNLGTINAVGGDVYLIAKHIDNQGTVNASEVAGKGGLVGLYATDELYLTTGVPEGGLVRVGSGSLSSGAGTGINNSGIINAVQADLKATGNLYSLAINNTGVVRATGATAKNGVVHLSAAGGTLSSSGTLVAKNADGSGGTIKVQSGSGGTTLVNGVVDASSTTGLGGLVELSGDNVALYDHGSIDASGALGGGTVYVGGSAHGTGDPSVYNSKATYIGANTTIKADATVSGKGGTVVAWSDGTTRFYGTISAKGVGAGNGGWVETSGKVYLDAVGLVNTGGGVWLLDPTDVDIGDSVTDTVSYSDSTSYDFSAAGSTSYISTASLFAALADNDVTVTASGNIIVTSSHQSGITGLHTLTLTADGNVILTNVTWSGDYGLSLVSNNGNIEFHTVALTGSAVTDVYNSSGSVYSAYAAVGNITLDGLTVTMSNLQNYGADSLQLEAGGAIATTGAGLIVSGGKISLISDNSTITLTSGSLSGISQDYDDAVYISADGTIGIGVDITSVGSTEIVSNNGNIYLGGNITLADSTESGYAASNLYVMTYDGDIVIGYGADGLTASSVTIQSLEQNYYPEGYAISMEARGGMRINGTITTAGAARNYGNGNYISGMDINLTTGQTEETSIADITMSSTSEINGGGGHVKITLGGSGYGGTGTITYSKITSLGDDGWITLENNGGDIVGLNTSSKLTASYEIQLTASGSLGTSGNHILIGDGAGSSDALSLDFTVGGTGVAYIDSQDSRTLQVNNGTLNGGSATLTALHDIEFSAGNLDLGSGGTATFTAVGNIVFDDSYYSLYGQGTATFSAGQDIYVRGVDWESSNGITGAFNLNFYANNTGTGTGSIYVIDSTISTLGGSVVMGGGSDGTGYAVENATNYNSSHTGVTLGGVAILSSTINAGTGSITLKGKSANVNGGMGVEISNFSVSGGTYDGTASNVFTSGSGVITITGVSGATSNTVSNSHGVFISASNVSASGVTSGGIHITGTGSASADSSSGVLIDNGAAVSLTNPYGEGTTSLTITGTSLGGGANNHGVTFRDGSYASVSGTSAVLNVNAYSSGTGEALAFTTSTPLVATASKGDLSTPSLIPYLSATNGAIKVSANSILYPTASYESSTISYDQILQNNSSNVGVFRGAYGTETLSIAPTSLTSVGVGDAAASLGTLWVDGMTGFGTINIGSLDGGTTITAGTLTFSQSHVTMDEANDNLYANKIAIEDSVISAYGNLKLHATGDITLSGSLYLSHGSVGNGTLISTDAVSDGTLTIEAGGNVLIGYHSDGSADDGSSGIYEDISNLGTNALSVTANQSVNLNGTIDFTNVDQANGFSITANATGAGGSFSMTGASLIQNDYGTVTIKVGSATPATGGSLNYGTIYAKDLSLVNTKGSIAGISAGQGLLHVGNTAYFNATSGSIGTSGNQVVFGAPGASPSASLAVTAHATTGDVYLDATGDGRDLYLNSYAGGTILNAATGTFSATNGAAVYVSSALSGGNIALTSTGNSVVVSSAVTATSSAAMTAATALTITGTTVSGSNITLNSGGTISVSSSTVAATSTAAMSATGPIAISASKITAATSINLASASTITIQNISGNFSVVHSANTTIDGATGLTFSGPGIFGTTNSTDLTTKLLSTDTITLKSDGHIGIGGASFSVPSYGSGSLHIETHTAGGTLAVDPVTAPGGQAYITSSDLTALSNFTTDGGTVYLGSTTGTVNVGQDISSLITGAVFQGAYTGYTYMQSLSGGGTLQVDANGTTVAGNVGTVTIKISGSKVNLDGVTGNVTLVSVNDPDLTGTVIGNLTGTFGESVTGSSALVVTGQLSLTVTGDITLTASGTSIGSFGTISATGTTNITGYSGSTTTTTTPVSNTPVVITTVQKTDPTVTSNSANSTTNSGLTVNDVKTGDTKPTDSVESTSGDSSGKSSSGDRKSDKKSATMGNNTTPASSGGDGKETVMGPGSSSVIGASGISTGVNVPPPPQLDRGLSSGSRHDLSNAIFGH